MSLCVAARKRAWREYAAEARKKTGRLAQCRCNHSKARYSTSVPLLSDQPWKSKSEYAKERLEEREFFLSLLKNSPSKRATNAYISRFSLPPKSKPPAPSRTGTAVDHLSDHTSRDQAPSSRAGVNLGSLYASTKAIEQTPVFTQQPLRKEYGEGDKELVHVALVKIRHPQILDTDTLGGIGLTISQLVRLGLNIVVVIDCDGPDDATGTTHITREWRKDLYQQAERIVNAISRHNKPGVILVNDALGYTDLELESPTTVHVRGRIEVQNRNLIVPLLESAIVPVIPPIACAATLSQNLRVDADNVVLALAREFAGITKYQSRNDAREGNQETLTKSVEIIQDTISLDRVIILDPLGGVASEERPNKSHVFINLDEEYGDIKAELSQQLPQPPQLTRGNGQALGRDEASSTLEASNPISKFAEREISSFPHRPSENNHIGATQKGLSSRHLKNLDLAKNSLQLLPPSSSALIMDPSAAAESSQQTEAKQMTYGVRTRRQKNHLIHNLLTDKPMISSSLPLSRFAHPRITTSLNEVVPNGPTFIKRGIPLTIIPNPKAHPWTPPGPGGTTLSLTGPQIDFPRLLHLIEDSFGRKLDVQHYLSRVRNRLAGIIIAGEYEGGAIFTWETPPNYPDSPPVPYLDKFAVLRRAQGTGGVADIVFKALLRQCFPKGCVWRSRANNPVNKWYFERSAGSWKLPGDQWTMFWSVEDGYGKDEVGLEGIRRTREERWKDWVDVCERVVPSWADTKAPD